MRKTILSMALVVLLGGPEALAQGLVSASKNSGGPMPAPVGHRQPRPADLPSGKEHDRSERSAQQGKRSPRPEDQEHLPRLLRRKRWHRRVQIRRNCLQLSPSVTLKSALPSR